MHVCVVLGPQSEMYTWRRFGLQMTWENCIKSLNSCTHNI